jgi:hypothetical protein
MDRDRRLDRSVSCAYVDDDVIGYADLDEYGRWSSTTWQLRQRLVSDPGGARLGTVSRRSLGVAGAVGLDLGRQCTLGLRAFALRSLGAVCRIAGAGSRVRAMCARSMRRRWSPSSAVATGACRFRAAEPFPGRLVPARPARGLCAELPRQPRLLHARQRQQHGDQQHHDHQCLQQLLSGNTKAGQMPMPTAMLPGAVTAVPRRGVRECAAGAPGDDEHRSNARHQRRDQPHRTDRTELSAACLAPARNQRRASAVACSARRQRDGTHTATAGSRNRLPRASAELKRNPGRASEVVVPSAGPAATADSARQVRVITDQRARVNAREAGSTRADARSIDRSRGDDQLEQQARDQQQQQQRDRQQQQPREGRNNAPPQAQAPQVQAPQAQAPQAQAPIAVPTDAVPPEETRSNRPDRSSRDQMRDAPDADSDEASEEKDKRNNRKERKRDDAP